METRANQLAHLFRSAGLREGDAVAILMENNEHYHTVMWAARRCGLYYVPINTHLTPRPRLPTSSTTVRRRRSWARRRCGRSSSNSATTCQRARISC